MLSEVLLEEDEVPVEMGHGVGPAGHCQEHGALLHRPQPRLLCGVQSMPGGMGPWVLPLAAFDQGGDRVV